MSCCSAAGPYRFSRGTGQYNKAPIADQLNSTRKHVASTTLERGQLEELRAVAGSVAEYVATLNPQAGPRYRCTAARGWSKTLLEHNLIDEFRMWIFPLVVGTGKRFFGEERSTTQLKLVDSKVSKTGVTINIYKSSRRRRPPDR